MAIMTRTHWNSLAADYRLVNDDDETWVLRWNEDSGTCLERAKIVDRNRLFALGQIVTTPGALSEVTPDVLRRCLARHAEGEWGNLGNEDLAANDAAVEHGGRILSAYQIDRIKLWIITESDRSVTTMLLPSEY